MARKPRTEYEGWISAPVILALNRNFMKHILYVLIICSFVVSCAQDKNPSVKPTIIKQIPHDRKAFTQGLALKEDYIYESTGLIGKSTIRVMSEDGKLIVLKKLPGIYFGEGLTILDNEIYQLTWKARIARVYSLPHIELVRSISYSEIGWGLTTVDNKLVMSNGSSSLHVFTKDFKQIDIIEVRYKDKRIDGLNELEYANGKIYANRWNSNYIFEIDYPSGNITRIIDCSDIANSLTGLGKEEVLNGIAYNQTRNSFYITGKNWPTIFEVRFPERTN
jgi:glutamine cyclotransferase